LQATRRIEDRIVPAAYLGWKEIVVFCIEEFQIQVGCRIEKKELVGRETGGSKEQAVIAEQAIRKNERIIS
jgi:hypothetical protein